MPVLEIRTNMAADVFPEDFHVKLSEVVANVLGRPKNVMVVCISTDERLYLGSGEPEPIFLLRIFNADAFDSVDENRVIVKRLSEFLAGDIGIPENSIRILLFNAPSTHIGLPGGQLLSDVIEERKKRAEKETKDCQSTNENKLTNVEAN